MWKFTIFLFYLVAILALGQTSLAISEFNCSDIRVDGIKFDLSSLNSLNGTQIENVEDTPPTYMKTIYQINPCAPLPFDEARKDEICPNGTYICQILINYTKRDDEGTKRIISIRPVAGNYDDSDRKLDPVKTLGPTLNKDDIGPLLITLHGGYYNNETQQADITFICAKDQENTTVIYKENTLLIEWKTRAACGEKLEEDKGMSGFTKFIVILIVIGLSYFGIGAAYNYHVYKAHGWDLLPHLDFWRDFPYLISDVFKYIGNSIRTGGRTGYSRV